MEFVQYLFNLVLVVPIVILLFFIAIKLGKTSLSKVGLHNHVSILERVNLSKDSTIFVLKMGDNEGCVGVLTPSGFQIIQSLDSNGIKELDDKKNQFLNQQKALDLKSKMSNKKNIDVKANYINLQKVLDLKSKIFNKKIIIKIVILKKVISIYLKKI